ncbi:hypothetical protein ACFYOK_11935 [Microbispora bryophytorum]|uniref:hypothetical protein n=1 Tax=Microbispora bryophytorum TaxID=1460882 RepID=UPI0033CC32F7
MVEGVVEGVVGGYRTLGSAVVAVSLTIASSADPDVVAGPGDVAVRAGRAAPGTDGRAG